VFERVVVVVDTCTQLTQHKRMPKGGKAADRCSSGRCGRVRRLFCGWLRRVVEEHVALESIHGLRYPYYLSIMTIASKVRWSYSVSIDQTPPHLPSKHCKYCGTRILSLAVAKSSLAWRERLAQTRVSRTEAPKVTGQRLARLLLNIANLAKQNSTSSD